MARRYEHVGKSSRDQEYYVRHLGQLGYTPTAEESFKFSESDSLEEDHSAASAGGKRSRPFTQSISENLKANWVGWAVILLMALAIYFATDFSRALGSMENMLDEVRRTLGIFEGKIEKIEDKIQDQEIQLKEQNIRMDYLEKSLEK
jgi:Sec-independent protein translocase protein TatA